MMKHRPLVVVAMLLGTLCASAIAGLIACPDCSKPVSDRAVMCPGCGCPGDAIRAVVQSNQTAKVELQPFCHSLVRVTSDQGEGVGACIQVAAQLYVVTTESLLAGVQSLALEKALDGEAVTYTSIELASDRNLARLAVNSTNLQPLAVADATSADLALVYISTNKTVALMQTGSAGPLPAGTALLDMATNLVMIIGASGGKHSESVGAVQTWIPVQPLAFRAQTTLLQKAEKKNGDGAAILKELQETKWLTPYLAQQAESLIKELKQRSEP